MSKKKFSQGLDDLFQDVESGQDVAHPAASTPAERKVAHKNFMSDLDALLQEALEESLEKYESKSTGSNKNRISAEQQPARRMTGLDSLIRQTIDVQEVTSDEILGKKRLTVAVDRTQLDKLKLIARLENAYLKDLLVGVIDEYINDYKQQKGIEL
ncbi:MAG: hypothetical protein WCR52_12970 [Bacteroidota bacterium]